MFHDKPNFQMKCMALHVAALSVTDEMIQYCFQLITSYK
jgi:hypothetical protein